MADYVALTHEMEAKVQAPSDNQTLKLGHEHGYGIHAANKEMLEYHITNKIETLGIVEQDIPAFRRGCWEGFLARRGGSVPFHIDDCPYSEVE